MSLLPFAKGTFCAIYHEKHDYCHRPEYVREKVRNALNIDELRVEKFEERIEQIEQEENL